jgi:hypothetical protein
LTGSLEAAWDGYCHVILRQKGTTGPNFHLPRSLVEELLGLFPHSSDPPETTPGTSTG